MNEVSLDVRPSVRKLKVLAEHPELTAAEQYMLNRHRTGYASDGHLDDPELSGVHDYYDFYAHLDPTHPAKPQPSHHLVPMPYGGLKEIVKHLMGPAPSGDAPVEKKTLYTKEFERLRYMIYRMNSDILRSEDRYKLGQLVRVPNEYVSV